MDNNILRESSVDISESIPDLKAKFWAFYWAVPLCASVPLAFLYWLWPTGRIVIMMLYLGWLITTLCKYKWAYRKLKNDFKHGAEQVYSGEVIEVKHLTTKKFFRTKKELLVTFKKGDQTADFVIWQNRRNPFFKQDDSLLFRYQELRGWLMTIHILPTSRYILSYEAQNKKQQQMKLWGNIRLMVLSSFIMVDNDNAGSYKLTKDNVDYIYFRREADDAHFVLELSSDTEYAILEIPSFLPDFAELEAWMRTLPDFDGDFYHAIKANLKETERCLLWERIYKVGIPHDSVYAGMKFVHHDDELITICNNGAKERIMENEVELITIRSFADVYKYADYELTMQGFATSSLSVRSRAENFDEVLHFIYSLPDFDRDKFQSLLMNLTETPLVVWVARPRTNASIVAVSGFIPEYLKVMERGIPIENKALTIEWADFQSLEDSGLASKQCIPSPNPDYHSFIYEIQNIVLLNGLRVEKLTFSSPPILYGEKLNKSWPLESAYVNIALGLEGAANYEKLKQHLTQLFDKMPQLNESGTHLEAYWIQGKLKVSIQAWQPYLVDLFFNCCSLQLEYKPDVSHFFENDYVKNFKLNEAIEYRIFDAALYIPADYKNNKFVRNTPTFFSDGLIGAQQFVIWIDRAENLIAIGNSKYVYIQPLKNHWGWLAVGNFWRDNPTELSLYSTRNKSGHNTGPKNNIGHFELSEEKLWRQLLDDISKFTRFECHYVEDRQYY